MERPDVSVVVIVYNDARRLPAAVDSILDQTLRNLEVIIVDDRSTDNTWEVVQQLAAKDSRIRPFRLDKNSGGCSRPRNVGLDHVRAPYVLFVDSDDTYERHSCKNLLLAAEKHDADVVYGMTRRYYVRGGKIVKSVAWYKRLHEGHNVYDHITENPDLLFHSLATDKLYRVDLLNREGIRFPEGWLYEDLLFNAKVLASCNKIVVIPNLVHRWMVDADADTPSITNQRADFRNFEHRIGILKQVDEFCAAHGQDALKEIKDVKFVRHDLRLYLRTMPKRDAEYKRRFMEVAGEYLPTVSPEAMRKSGIVPRIACYYILKGDLDQVLRTVNYTEHKEKLSADLVERDGRIYWADFDPADDEAREILDVTDMHWHITPLTALRLYHKVTGFSPRGSALHLEVETTNPLGRIPRKGTKIQLAFRWDKATKHHLTTAKITAYDAKRIRWTVDVDLDKLLPVSRPGHRAWLVTVRTVLPGGEVNTSPLTVLHPDLDPVDGKAVEIHPRKEILVGNKLEAVTSDYGNLFFRLANDNELGVKAVQLLRESKAAAPVREARAVARKGKAKLASREVKTRAYPLLQRLPVKKGSVVFEAHMGAQYSDSPKYIYEELKRSGLPYRPIWAYARQREKFPQDCELVRRGSWKYYLELARAEFWVDNQGFPRQFTKRPQTTYVQTWHGTPLKHMGWDEPALAALPADKRREHEAMIERWDALVVPNEYFVDTFVKSYAYKGRLLRSGYPRNDLLVTAGKDPEVIAATKLRLGLPADRKLVLYAPTFRPRPGKTKAISLELRLEEMEAALGADHFIMVRTHYFETHGVAQRFAHFARGVNDHHDVTDLMLVADVLVTDYSSVMFDYANLRRPMIFFTYDYEDYMLHRGTYFDLAAEAPGPIVTTTADVVKCLLDIDAVATQYAEQLARFAERFGTYETGHAARTVVEEIFGRGRRS
jgi:CDP-glycerol glycerophosphotransferase